MSFFISNFKPMTIYSYNSYIKTTFYYVIFFIILIALTNFIIDPGKVYSKYSFYENKDMAEEYVKKLTSSKYGLSIPKNTLNERNLKKTLAKYPIDYDCAIIGSSHVMQVSTVRKHNSLQDLCSNMKNLGVSGGSLEDYLALTNIILNNKKHLPKTIVFGIDPWSLKLNQDIRWSEYKQDYFDMRNKLLLSNESTSFVDKSLIFNLINLQYFKRSLGVLFTGEILYNPIQVSEFIYSNGLKSPVTLPDGSHIYASEYIKNARQSINKISGSHSYKIVKGKFYHPHAVNLFKKLITHLKEREINVVLLLTPYHYKVWSVESQPIVEVMKTVENKIRSLAESLEIQVIGSYNPNAVGCLPDEFYDAMHAKSE